MVSDRVFLDYLTELRFFIREATAKAEASEKIAPNSYGAGYDRGTSDALKALLEVIVGSKYAP